MLLDVTVGTNNLERAMEFYDPLLRDARAIAGW